MQKIPHVKHKGRRHIEEHVCQSKGAQDILNIHVRNPYTRSLQCDGKTNDEVEMVYSFSYLCLVPKGPGRGKTEESMHFANPFFKIVIFYNRKQFPNM
jgi:ATP-dependent protease Clp ATPase subunit